MSVDEPTTFSRALELWRRELHLGHNAFARHLEISHGYWNQIRTGKREPSMAFVKAVLNKADEPWRSALERAHVTDLSVAAVA